MADQAAIQKATAQVVDMLVTYLTRHSQPEQAATSAPSQDAVQHGARIQQVVRAGVEQHGDEYERNDLANFEREPQRYREFIVHMVSSIATRSPAFAQQLQMLAQT